MDIIKVTENLLRSQNINTHILTKDNLINFDKGLRNNLYPQFSYSIFLDEFENCQENTVYYYTDIFDLNYLILKLPEEGNYLCAGPYTFKLIDETVFNDINQRCRFPSLRKKELLGYFIVIPYIATSANWYSLVHTLAIYLFDTEDINIIFKNFDFEKQLDNQLFYKDEIKPMLKIKVIEERYKNENELMQSIRRGDIKQSLKLLNIRQQNKLEPRTPDPIRDCKNYLFVQNTLFRKAIEQGGVLPYYLDEISTKYAKLIETVTSEVHANYIGVEMAKEYCKMVNNHAHPNYSPFIKRVVSYIELNLIEPLSLSYLAHQFHMTDAYFSTLFKKEVGITLTHYIQQTRMKEATYYLKETDLKIIDIASIVGIPDLNYFIKIFKKYYMMVPTEYRHTK